MSAGRKRRARARRPKPGQLYELAKEKAIAGRSKMGKWELIEAIRKAK